MKINDNPTILSNDKKRCADTGEPTRKLAKKVKTKHMDQNVLHLRKTIQRCCGTNDLFTALEAYDRLYVNGDTKIEAQTFYNLLNLCEGISRSNEVHIGTPKHNVTLPAPEMNKNDSPKHEFTMEERKYHAFRIKSEMDKLGLALNETSYTALVRILCKTFDLEEAEKMITQAEQRQQCKPKLRMYSCLISAYCEKDDLKGALRTWARMLSIKRINKTGREEISIELTEREYCTILKCATRLGDVKVIDRVMSEIADEVLVPSMETTNVITEWFESGRALKTKDGNLEKLSALDVVQNLPPTNAPSIGPFQVTVSEENKEQDWKVEREVSIDPKSGVLHSCGLAGKRLKPLALDNNAWKAMMEMNEAIVLKGELDAHGKITEFAGGGKGKKRIVTKEEMEKREKHWTSFLQFLQNKFGPPFSERTDQDENVSSLDIVIDGANVGYYKQNFSAAPKHVDYRQIDWVIKQLNNQGKNVLVFMHERHFSKKLMPSWAGSIVERWDRDGVLFRTPYGANDDWFWMHTALWCGRGTMVLSNDEMRDHHFQMLAHRQFLRWKERHQVHFSFDEFDHNTKMRPIQAIYPDIYSRRVQRLDDTSLVIPLPKKGDENRFLDGCHKAVEGVPEDETYVCIYLQDNSSTI